MQSEKVSINNMDSSITKALTLTDAFIEEASSDPSMGSGYSGKTLIHIRLLAEETLGMLRAMVGEYKARFWIEADKNELKIKLTATTDMDIDKKSELLSVSKSGKNAAVKGFMSKIGDIIQNSLLNVDNVSMLQTMYGGSMVDYGYNNNNNNNIGMEQTGYVWTLKQYRDALEHGMFSGDGAEELEKSIVASLADDVIVGVKKDNVTLEIVKKIKK